MVRVRERVRVRVGLGSVGVWVRARTVPLLGRELTVALLQLGVARYVEL